MSAFMPDAEHFRWLVSYAIANHVSWAKVPMSDRKALRELAQDYESIWRIVTFDTADEVMRMLRHETYKSLSARYGDPIPKLEDVEVVSIPADYGSPDHDVIGRVADCYEYQSCEHEGWHTSEALRFTRAVRESAYARLYHAEAPWEARNPWRMWAMAHNRF